MTVATSDPTIDIDLSDLDLDFSELDASLDRALARADEATKAAAAKARLRSGAKLDDRERQQLKDIIHSWELRTEWDAVAAISLWVQYSCSCGSTSTPTFAGLAEQQQHRTRANDRRLLRVSAVNSALPFFVRKQILPVPMCHKCCEDKGWNIDSAEVLDETIYTPTSILNLG